MILCSKEPAKGDPPCHPSKVAARAIVDKLPEQATWDDLMYELYVKQKIEAGLKAADEGRTVPHEEIKARLLARKNQ